MATKWTPELNALVKQRSGLEKGSNEYNAVQNQINKAMGSTTRHNVAEIAPETSQMDEHSAQMDARDTRQNQAMQQTVNNATSAGGGQIKNTGTGNTYAAALTPDGSGFTPLDSYYASAANREGMTPQFSPGEDRTNKYTQDDIHFDSTTDEGIENRFSDPNFKGRTEKQTARAIKSIARDKARKTRKSKTAAERKTDRINKRAIKSDARYDKKHGTNLSGLR